MKSLLILLFLFLFSSFLFGQDTLITKKNKLISCNVIAITATHINYTDSTGVSKMIELQKVKDKKIHSNPSMLFDVNKENQFEDFVSYGEAYRNVKDFNEKKPFLLSEVSFKESHRKPNFYLLKCDDLNTEIELNGMKSWGIFYNNNLYLNSLRLGMSGDYVKVLEYGKFCYFLAEPVRTKEDHDRVNNMGIMFGLAGALVTSAIIYNENKDNIHYLVNLEGSGNPHLLNKYYLQYLLQDYSELLTQFKSEVKPDDLETQLKYIRLLNKMK